MDSSCSRFNSAENETRLGSLSRSGQERLAMMISPPNIFTETGSRNRSLLFDKDIVVLIGAIDCFAKRAPPIASAPLRCVGFGALSLPPRLI